MVDAYNYQQGNLNNRSNLDTYYYDYYYDYLDNYWQHRGRIFIFTYIAPFVIILGTLGNLVAFIVLQNESYRKQSTGFILSALAVVDTGMLNTGLLRHWLIEWVWIDIRAFSLLSCRLHYFLTFFFSHASPMTITIMTAERVVSVWWPFKVKSMFTRLKVAMVWSGLMLLLVFINFHSFFTLDVYKDSYNTSHCYFANHSGIEEFHMGAFYWIDAVLRSFLPVILIFTGNILIIAKLLSATNERRQSMGVRSYNRSVSTVTSTKSTTTMLLTVSFFFLLCTVPFSIYLIGTGKAGWWPEESIEDVAKLDLAYAFFNLIFYLNNAINFPLYCLAGSRFRQIMVRMFCKPTVERFSSSLRRALSANARHSSNGSTSSNNRYTYSLKDVIVNSTTDVTTVNRM